MNFFFMFMIPFGCFYLVFLAVLIVGLKGFSLFKRIPLKLVFLDVFTVGFGVFGGYLWVVLRLYTVRFRHIFLSPFFITPALPLAPPPL